MLDAMTCQDTSGAERPNGAGSEHSNQSPLPKKKKIRAVRDSTDSDGSIIFCVTLVLFMLLYYRQDVSICLAYASLFHDFTVEQLLTRNKRNI